MSVILQNQTNITEDKFISQTWVKGNVSSVLEARVVVLLEMHQPSKNSPYRPFFLQKHFGPQDIIFIEEPTTESSDILKAKVKNKFNLELKREQVRGWDDGIRVRLWTSFLKVEKEFDKVILADTEASLFSSFEATLKNEIITPEIREIALKDYEKIKSYSVKEVKLKKLKNLIAKVKCLTLDHFSELTFPKSQNSLLACLSATEKQNPNSKIWVIAGEGHGDPKRTRFLPEVHKLINQLGQTKYMMLNTGM